MKGVIFMSSGKKIYTTKIKLKVVQRYLKGDISINHISKELHVNKMMLEFGEIHTCIMVLQVYVQHTEVIY